MEFGELNTPTRVDNGEASGPASIDWEFVYSMEFGELNTPSALADEESAPASIDWEFVYSMEFGELNVLPD